MVFICSQMKIAYGYKYVPILNGLIKSPSTSVFEGIHCKFGSAYSTQPLEFPPMHSNGNVLPSNFNDWILLSDFEAICPVNIDCVCVCPMSIAPAIAIVRWCCTHTFIDNFGMFAICAMRCCSVLCPFGCERIWNVAGRGYGSYTNNHNISY